METKRGRGRPAVYVGNQVKMLCSMIRRIGATNTMKACHAADGTPEASARPKSLLQSNISMPTLLTMASKAGIVLHRGRPKTKKIAVAAAKKVVKAPAKKKAKKATKPKVEAVAQVEALAPVVEEVAA